MTRSLALVAALLLSAASAAAADVAATPAAGATATLTPAPEKEKPAPFPLHASASLTQQVGSATFVADNGVVRNPTTSTALTLAPSAVLTKDWSLSLSQTIGIEETASEGTTYQHQLELSDLNARISYGGLKWDELNLGLSLSAAYNLPISMSSRFLGSLGSTALGSRLSFNHKESGFSASGSAGIGYNPIVEALAGRVGGTDGSSVAAVTYNDRTLGPSQPLTCTQRAGETQSACLGGAWATGLSWRFGVGVGYTPPVLDGKLSLAADMGYSSGLSTFIAPTTGTDNLGYDNGELKGEHAQDIAFRQGTSGNLSASYAITDWFVATAGAQSGQPFLNARGDGIRFPFWDFTSTANNFSALYVDANFSY